MYYPLQIPNLLNVEFKKSLQYREYHHQNLEKCIMCIWSMKSFKPLSKTIYNTILPDGCVDLIIDLTQRQIFFSAFSKASQFFELSGQVDFLGIRFKPGAFHHIYDKDSHLVMDHMISYDRIENFDLTEIFNGTNIQKQIEFLIDYLQNKTKNYTLTPFEKFVDVLYENLHEKTISSLAEEFHYSQRNLNRLFYVHFGVNPKTFLNILRLHKSLSILFEDPSNNLAQLALKCGFYDQSHFIKTIQRYCGISPKELIDYYSH